MPTVTQYASPELIAKIAYDDHPAEADPNWASSGAVSQLDYGRWCRHICGMACLRMVLLHRDGAAPRLFDLLSDARTAGAYRHNPLDAGGHDITGMYYRPFAEYVERTHDLPAVVHGELTMFELQALLDSGLMVMASVSKEIRRPNEDPARRGGHLVLATGRNAIGDILFNNPSGHTPETLATSMPLARFADFFGDRGISLDPRTRALRTPAPDAPARPVASH
ncbi:C39 family peptidase [Streptomyces sp. NPDC006703]|uniref:C39 family peptidase n=1 Tax=Streptomyces sp. NPDC006703 TaxID=3364759 RepID=UPI0036817BA9